MADRKSERAGEAVGGRERGVGCCEEGRVRVGSWSDQVEERDSREVLEWDWSQGRLTSAGGGGFEGVREEVREEGCWVEQEGVEKEAEVGGVE